MRLTMNGICIRAGTRRRSSAGGRTGVRGASSAVTPLAGNVLWIKYGSGLSDEVVWSTLDRKFSDLDLRVTMQQIAGPVDENQYGVVFRYRDAENFYVFRITSDGYYSLAKSGKRHSGKRQRLDHDRGDPAGQRCQRNPRGGAR